ncbi:MAG: protein translocase subunit SecDF [Bacteroidales bacterium]
MQNKGAIRLFAIAFAIVCIYQLSFTWVAYRVDQKAEDYARQIAGDNEEVFEREKREYLDSVSGLIVYNLGIVEYSFNEVKQRELNLGLDLKGGMNVTLEVSVEDMIRALSNNSKDTTFQRALVLAKQMQRESQEDFITLFGRAFNQIDPNAQLAAIFATREMKDRITFNTPNDEVLQVIKDETENAIDNSFNIISSRIDQFGVIQPKIQRLETHGRILVELPGVDDPERIRRILQSTAHLEFWETFENSEVYESLLEANEVIKQIEEDTDAELIEEGEPLGTITEEERDTDALLTDEGSIADTTEQELSLLEQLETDTTLADTLAPDDFMEDFPLFSVLQPNVTRDNQIVPGSIVGFTHLKDTGKVNYYLSLARVRALFPRNLRFLWSATPTSWNESVYELHAIKITTRDGEAPLDGDMVTNARAEFGQNQASAEVTMTMNAEGAKIWARLTGANIGRCIAIVLDEKVRSAPRVNSEIKGGNSSITGDFSIREAQDLANILKSGKLPARTEIIQEEVVGPSLGQEAINAGLNSFLIAFLIVILYMVFYYSRSAGLVADIALVTNMFFILGVLASLGAVLTLPGIAGIVLTIGMSVDANVLIFERVKEEMQSGKGIKMAITDGYKNAYSAIIDANVTTLLTGIILYVFGTGAIKGFATTLVIGILTSLFTAIFITRLIFTWGLDKNWNIKFGNKITKNAFKNINFQFIQKRKVFYVISGIIFLIGVGSLVVRGLNEGIDFTGGRSYIIRFDKPVESTVEIANMLGEPLEQEPEVIIYGQSNQIRITTKYLIRETGPHVDSLVNAQLFEGLKPMLPDDVTYQQFLDDYRMISMKVGPTIADDLKVAAMYAISFSLLIIFIYMLARFRNWQFGLGAVAALVHDTFIILGIFSLLYGRMPFSLEIDQAFIAAILTVVGYSINDTVVVFDRIREYFKLYPKRDRIDVYNSALNSTLSRTFNTSISTFVVLLTIFLFGGEVIRGFIFSLLLGIIVGTYSSLFIATPVVYDTISQKLKRGTKK